MSRACSTCGSSDIDFDPSRGDTVCTNCGSVLEESVIVSEVTFQDNSAGGSSVIGQFVSNEGNKVGQGLGFRPGLGRESRTVTLENGKRRLQAIASQLQLNNHCVESAYMFFKLAVSKRLTKGRRTNYVAAACLYLVCRTEKTPHLLIDFSDILQVDVMVLGRIFLKLQHELCINLPVIDPCLYIHRFSHQFQLGDREQDVTNTALRLVSRMKRDWIQYGRRPSGLCGAALLVASRLHGFSRTVKQVVKVVRLSNTTIRKRLSEFMKTPSGKLTVDEFNTIDLEEEQDPPCFTKNRQRLKQQQMEINGLDKPSLAKELEDLRKEIEAVLNRTKAKSLKNSTFVQLNSEPNIAEDCDETNSLDGDQANSLDGDQANSLDGDQTNSLDGDQTNSLDGDQIRASLDTDLGNCSGLNISSDSIEACISTVRNEESVIAENKNAFNDSLEGQEDSGKLDEKSKREQSNETMSNGFSNNDENVEEEEKNEDLGKKENKDGLSDLDDDELDAFILTAPEVEVKTKVWMEENKDYLERLKEKEEREILEKEENELNKKKRRKPYKKRSKEKASSVGEAVEKMLIEKKISHKINYDVLRNLNKENELEKPSKPEPEMPSSEPVSGLLQAVQPSIPVRYKGRKRDKNILPRLPTKRVKFSDSTTEKEAENNGTSCIDKAENKNDVVVESGPVDYDQDQEYFNDEDADEDDHLSAVQLMGEDYGRGEIEYGDLDEY